MPFVEVLGFERSSAKRTTLSAKLTAGLATAFDISPDIISIYYLTLDGGSYAHAGRLDPGEEHQRIFIKVHAFRRDDHKRAAAAQAMTRAVAESCGVPPKNVAVYFLERTPNEVAHQGILEGQH